MWPDTSGLTFLTFSWKCGDLAPLYGFTLVCVRLKSGVVPPHSKALRAQLRG